MNNNKLFLLLFCGWPSLLFGSDSSFAQFTVPASSSKVGLGVSIKPLNKKYPPKKNYKQKIRETLPSVDQLLAMFERRKNKKKFLVMREKFIKEGLPPLETVRVRPDMPDLDFSKIEVQGKSLRKRVDSQKNTERVAAEHYYRWLEKHHNELRLLDKERCERAEHMINDNNNRLENMRLRSQLEEQRRALEQEQYNTADRERAFALLEKRVAQQAKELKEKNMLLRKEISEKEYREAITKYDPRSQPIVEIRNPMFGVFRTDNVVLLSMDENNSSAQELKPKTPKNPTFIQSMKDFFTFNQLKDLKAGERAAKKNGWFDYYEVAPVYTPSTYSDFNEMYDDRPKWYHREKYKLPLYCAASAIAASGLTYGFATGKLSINPIKNAVLKSYEGLCGVTQHPMTYLTFLPHFAAYMQK